MDRVLALPALPPAERAAEVDRVQGLPKRTQLKLAMKAGKKIEFDYTRKDGATGRYKAHPYSFRSKGGKRLFYATESKHGHSQIHSFVASRVKGLEIQPTKDFVPKWPTEPRTVK